MSLPLQEIPKELKSNLGFYADCFSKPQAKHFTELVTGLIVSDNKTVQEINDCFSRTDQSSLNRFLTESEWDWKEINDVRIDQITTHCVVRKGVLIIDPTFLHKTGKKIEKANYHYSGVEKGKAWGHFLIDSFFSDGKNAFPVFADMYLRKEDADENHPFRTIREMCIEQIEYGLKKLPVWLVMMDAGLYADFLLRDIKTKKLKYIAGVRITNLISINREKKISIDDYLSSITDTDFQYYFHKGEAYFLHVKEVYTKGVGKEKLLISFKEGDEENIKIYTTNILDMKDETLMSLLLRRWEIECLHRDTKQHLGIEDYQVRKFGAIQKVVCAVLVAYTQLILSKRQEILKPLKRCLRTIGEGCRFFRLIALKGMSWLKNKAKHTEKLRKIMNTQVFVKNAKA